MSAHERAAGAAAGGGGGGGLEEVVDLCGAPAINLVDLASTFFSVPASKAASKARSSKKKSSLSSSENHTIGDDNGVVDLTAVQNANEAADLFDGLANANAAPVFDVMEVLEQNDDAQKTTSKKNKAAALALQRPTRATRSTCPICLCDGTEPHEAIKLSACAHVMCEDCARQYVVTKVTDAKVLYGEMQCPHGAGTDDACKTDIAPRDVRALLADDKANLQKYEKFCMQRLVEADNTMACCPTAGCPYVYVLDNDPPPRFDCPMCSSSYCVKCRCKWHNGKTCAEMRAENGDEAASESLFKELAKKSKMKQCPRCKHWVEKNSGCDAIHCRCGLTFCYRCGGTRTQTKGVDVMCKCKGMDGLLHAHERAEAAGRNHNRPDLVNRRPQPLPQVAAAAAAHAHAAAAAAAQHAQQMIQRIQMQRAAARMQQAASRAAVKGFSGVSAFNRKRKR